MDRSTPGLPDWKGLESLVVSNFELELRSEGKCGFRRWCVDARETYILNDEIVVDVFAIFNRFCEIIIKKNNW